MDASLVAGKAAMKAGPMARWWAVEKVDTKVVTKGVHVVASMAVTMVVAKVDLRVP